MDWLSFWAEVIKAVAWPVAVLTIFLIIRKPLLRMIPLIERLQYKGLELDFDRRVQELTVDAKRQIPAVPDTGDGRKRLSDHLIELARMSPRAVVLEAWLQLEEAAIDATRRHGLALKSRELHSPILLGDALEEAGVLDASKQEIFYRLRNLRNAAAHASDFAFDADSAIKYADAALRLADFLHTA